MQHVVVFIVLFLVQKKRLFEKFHNWLFFDTNFEQPAEYLE